MGWTGSVRFIDAWAFGCVFATLGRGSFSFYLETVDFLSNLVHTGELRVERGLPGFSVSDLQTIPRTDHDDVSWELQCLDLPCGQTDTVVGIDIHFLGC